MQTIYSQVSEKNLQYTDSHRKEKTKQINNETKKTHTLITEKQQQDCHDLIKLI